MAPKLDTVIIISGDGDFVPLVEFLKINKGCQVEVVSFGRSSSQRLKEVADDFIDLDENTKKYCIGRSQRRNTKKKSQEKQGRKPQEKDSGVKKKSNTRKRVVRKNQE